MSDNVAFKASYLLGEVHVRIAMALEREMPSETLDDLKALKDDLDHKIGKLYYSNSESSPT
jgi:predicted Co/Zn/Cd cation transporter (cation efflux family)